MMEIFLIAATVLFAAGIVVMGMIIWELLKFKSALGKWSNKIAVLDQNRNRLSVNRSGNDLNNRHLV